MGEYFDLVADRFGLPRVPRLSRHEAEQQLSPLHRHLYLLGVHLGGEASRIEDSGGKFSLPPASLIGRHATLAGVPAALWQPLAAEPKDEPPQQVLQRYRAALQALADELARRDAADRASRGGR